MAKRKLINGPGVKWGKKEPRIMKREINLDSYADCGFFIYIDNVRESVHVFRQENEVKAMLGAMTNARMESMKAAVDETRKMFEDSILHELKNRKPKKGEKGHWVYFKTHSGKKIKMWVRD